MPAFAELLADLIVLLGREGTRADARRVRLHDPEHEPRARGADAAPRTRRSRNRVGRGDERIGAVVDVEKHALRAFEQHALALAQRDVEVAPHGLGEGQHELGDLGQIILQPFAVDRRLAEAGAERIVMRAQAIEQRLKIPQPR